MIVLGVAAVAVVFASAGTATKPLVRRFSRVVVVVMENKDFADVIGSPDAPYINALARRYALATGYYGVAHPSLPNYLALLSGSTSGGRPLRQPDCSTRLSARRLCAACELFGGPHARPADARARCLRPRRRNAGRGVMET